MLDDLQTPYEITVIVAGQAQDRATASRQVHEFLEQLNRMITDTQPIEMKVDFSASRIGQLQDDA